MSDDQLKMDAHNKQQMAGLRAIGIALTLIGLIGLYITNRGG
jgi:hypothetical protein